MLEEGATQAFSLNPPRLIYYQGVSDESSKLFIGAACC